MATTPQEVFDLAMGLMDEVNESTGATDTSDTREYKQRTLFILNVIKGELYPFSDTYASSGKLRPISATLTGFDQAIDLDDFLCRSIMPYGLAAHLLLDENPDAASFFQQRYEWMIARHGNAPAVFEPIEDAYGILR